MYGMARIAGLGAFLLMANSGAAVAQGLLNWMEDLFGGRSTYEPRREPPEQWPPGSGATDATMRSVMEGVVLQLPLSHPRSSHSQVISRPIRS